MEIFLPHFVGFERISLSIVDDKVEVRNLQPFS